MGTQELHLIRQYVAPHEEDVLGMSRREGHGEQFHTGDQNLQTDFSWIDTVKNSFRVDVLLVNARTPDLNRMAEGMDPGLIITGDENEGGADMPRRVPWAYSLDRLSTLTQIIALLNCVGVEQSQL